MKKQKKHAESPGELQDNLKDIEAELKLPVDKKKMQSIFKKLEGAQEDCACLKSKYTIFTKDLLSECETRIRSLFGEVLTSHVDTEIDEILVAALRVDIHDEEGKEQIVAKIHDLLSWHRPSKTNLGKIAQAEKHLKGDTSSEESSDIDPIEAQNLLEIASLVYHKNVGERNKLYLSLSDGAKEKFQKHLVCLKTKAFEKETSTIQALFASAFEIAGVPTKYPSSNEIDEFFSEESSGT